MKSDNDEEIMRLDVRKAKEDGYEYYMEYFDHPIDTLSDNVAYKAFDGIVVIGKRRIKAQEANNGN